MRLLAILAAFLTLALAPAGHAQEPDLTGFAPNVRLSTLGAKVPDDPIVLADGTTASLADYEGEVLVITLWQIHCPYCHREMPVLDRLAGDMQGTGVRVLPLGLDQDIAALKAHIDERGYAHLPAIMDVDKFVGSLLSIEHFDRLGIATPTSFVVGKDGIVVARIWGLVDWDGDAARDYLRALAAT